MKKGSSVIDVGRKMYPTKQRRSFREEPGGSILSRTSDRGVLGASNSEKERRREEAGLTKRTMILIPFWRNLASSCSSSFLVIGLVDTLTTCSSSSAASSSSLAES